jgi:DNA-binding CsgD family transcriptional regulator
VHPLVRDAVYHELPVGERELQHSRAAKMLADAGAPPEQVASHLLVIPRRGEEWVGEQLQAAAAEAMRKGAGDSAVAYLERALEEAPPGELRAQVLLGLGAAAALTSAPEAAIHLRRAYDEFTDPVGRAMAADALARTLLFIDAADEGAAVAREAADGLPPGLESERDGLEALEITAAGYFGGGSADILERLRPYRSRREWDGAGSKMLEVITALEWCYSGGPAEECAALSTHGLRGGELVERDPGLMGVIATIVLALADRDEAMEAWDMLLADAHRRGSLLAMAGVDLWRGFTLFRRGELAEADALIDGAFERVESWGFGMVARAYNAGLHASVLVERGRLDEARDTLMRYGVPGGRSYGSLFWKTSETLLLAAEGRAEETIAAAEECAARWPEAVNPAISPWRSLKAEALHQLGRTEEAIALAKEELEIARGFGAPGTVGRALRVLGALEGAAGIDRLREAVEVLDPSPSRLQHAQALAALASAIRADGRPDEAVRPLERALELAQVCGADGLAARVRVELVESGAAPGAATGIAALTSTELRVAELAAMGQSDRDIAQALFVTPNTVEVQLSEVFRKLGVDSRRGLVLALATSARRRPRSLSA